MLHVLHMLLQPTQVLGLVLLKGVLVTVAQSVTQFFSSELRNKGLEHEAQVTVFVTQVAQLELHASQVLLTSLVIVVS